MNVLVFLLMLFSSTEDTVHESLQKQYQAGLYQEEVMGDLETAIRTYRGIIKSEADSEIVALARLRLGLCYEKQAVSDTDRDKAQDVYFSEELKGHEAVRQVALQHGTQLMLRRTFGVEPDRSSYPAVVDSFEDANLGKDWVLHIDNPKAISIERVMLPVYAGEYSLRFRVESGDNTGRVGRYTRSYPEGAQGIWSIWYYDNGNFTPELNTSGTSSVFELRNDETFIALGKSSRFVPGYYACLTPHGRLPTGVPLSEGWHHFQVRVDTYGAKVYIDGLIQTTENNQLRNVSRVGITFGGTSFAPDDHWDYLEEERFRPLLFTEIGEYTAGSSGDSPTAAWTDLNGDGLLDVYTAHTGVEGINVLSLNRGGYESFQVVTREFGLSTREEVTSAVWVDYDRDGNMDLYVTSDLPGGSLYRNSGMEQFERVNKDVGINHSRVGQYSVWFDADGDGWEDIYVASADRLYGNVAGQRFVDRTMESGLPESLDSAFAACADYDRDGAIDLYLAGHGESAGLYQNTGDGHFTPVSLQAGLSSSSVPVWAAWGDYNADGFPDLYLVNDGEPNRLMHNRGDGTFQDVAQEAGLADPRHGIMAAWGDYDADGFPDLYVLGRSNEQWEWLYHSDGKGRFTEMHREASMYRLDSEKQGRHATWVDYDSDGDLDLYVTTSAGHNLLYRNNHNQPDP